MEGSLLLLLVVCSSGLQAQETERITARTGGTVTVQCEYPAADVRESKAWCREGREENYCDRIITTIRGSPWTYSLGRTTIVDNQLVRLISVTLERLTVWDTAVYWCGVYNPNTKIVNIMKRIKLEVTTDLRSSSVKPFTTEDVPTSTDSKNISQKKDLTYSLPDLYTILIAAGLGLLLLITLITAMFYGTRMRRRRMQSTKDVGDNSRTIGAGPGASRNETPAEEDTGVNPYELDSQELKYASLTLHANRQQEDGTYGNIEYGRRPAPGGTSEEPVEYASINLHKLHGASAE